ncbi:hypothetical protein J2S74_002282 [Evansella vedderi]|uniref:Uncharacterized protein n=1 Tax=Evansella vedderi TaxID=38282 RepID=A0ABT9ZVC9_9BACI|nr:hypothetical protein [Evansella vedderi]MDQ0254900.1 hypothetical protein [Evansella vedderi]
MNAAEARMITAQNSEKVAEVQLKTVIETMENQIAIAARNGRSFASISIDPGQEWYVHYNNRKLAGYFENLGYEVRINSLMTNTVLSCSWI